LLTIFQRGPEIGDDEDDYGTQGRRINTKERTKKQKVLKVYRGRKASRLFLQAYQYILWKQCYALIHEKGFLGELWTVVRDLWTLRLSKLLHRLEGPLDGEDSDDIHGLSSGIDPSGESGSEKEARTKQAASALPTLIDTICLCYMGMLLMRLPISLSQVLRWIHEEDVPYIRAIRHVPVEMRHKLPGEYHEALDTSTILRPELLQLGVLKLCSVYSRLYGMEISPLNSTPMLYEYVKSLSVPLEVYAAAQNLNDVLKFDFKYGGSGGKRRTVLSYPEAQLMSLVVVATKLLFPFDNESLQRYPQNGAEQGILMVDWNTWMDTRKASKDSESRNLSLENGEEIHVKDTDVFNMSAQQLDQYMNWYQRTWARPQVADDDMNRELLEMFPIPEFPDKHIDRVKVLRDEEIKVEQVKAIQASLKTSGIVLEEQAEEASDPILRPGTRYQQFRDRQGLSVSAVAQAFHQEAARLSCLSLDMLLRAVLQAEQKITLWRRAKRRAEKFGETMNLEAEGVILPGLEGLDQMTLAEAAVDVEERESRSDDSDDNMRMIE
jgi:RNA polymerase I-specific transcription initiation factor RRN7